MHYLILRNAISRALGREKAELFRKRKDIHLILNAFAPTPRRVASGSRGFDDMVDVLLELTINDVRAEIFKAYPQSS